MLFATHMGDGRVCSFTRKFDRVLGERVAVDPHSSIGPPTRVGYPARHPLASSHIMSSDSSDRNAITSTEEFDTALERLLRRARRGGVDVRGSWVYRSTEQTYDLEVMVYELDGADASD